MPTAPPKEIPQASEQQLCLSCMAPNAPAAHFCCKCAAPLTSYASTGPFESLFAEGSVYRSAADHPQKLIVVLGVWVIFGIGFFAGIFLMVLGRDTGFAYTLGGAFMLLISAAMIWKATRNYLARKPRVTEPEA